MAPSDIVPVGHDHNPDPRFIRAAQSLVDRNMYVFTEWVSKELKTIKGVKHSEKLLLRGFFAFVKRNLHRAVCAEAWHYLGDLTDKIIELASSGDQDIEGLSKQLASPETKMKLKDALGLSDDEVKEITAVEIARAFRKMFKVEVARKLLTEFRAQVKFVEEHLRELGFP
jgi:hypothetical protein